MRYPPIELVVDPNSTLGSLPTLLKVPEVAELSRMSENTVYELAARGEIPGVVYFGRSIRFVRDIVLEWMCSQGRGTPSRSAR
jgi:excisionase family DNA binding protein